MRRRPTLADRWRPGRRGPRTGRRGHDARWRCRGRRRAADRLHQLLDVAGDVRHERRAGVLAARDPRESRLPRAGQLGRRQALGGQPDHEPDAHRRRHQVRLVAHHVGAAQQRLDDRRAGGRRAEAAILHRRARLVIVHRLARRLHRAEQRRLGVPGRRRGRARERTERAVERLALDEDRQRRRPGRLPLATLLTPPGAVARGADPGDLLPARDHPHAPAREVTIRRRRQRGHHRHLAIAGVPAPLLALGALVDALGWQRVRRARPDADPHLRGRDLRVRKEHAEEPARDQIEHAPLVAIEAAEPRGRRGGDDRVVVADPGVVDDPPRRPRGLRDQALGERRVVGRPRERAEHARQLGDHVRRQVARVRARVRQQLVPLVQRLRDLERARRREPEPAVRRALQRGQVEQHRGRLVHGARSHPLDARPHRIAGGAVCVVAGDDLVGERHRGEARELAVAPARLERVAGGGAQLDADLPVRARHERADRLLALDQHRERGRLHAADRVQRVVAGHPALRGDRARGVHADQPVRLRARPGGVSERVEVSPRPQRAEAAPDRLVGERRDPQPLHRQPRLRVLVDVAEDQLALAPGITGVDDRGEPPVAQQRHHRLEMRRGVLGRPQLEHRGQHRQRVQPPRLPPLVVRGRLVELDQVPDAPRDRAAIVLERVLPARAHAQHARQIARDGRLLRDDQLHRCTAYLTGLTSAVRALAGLAALHVQPLTDPQRERGADGEDEHDDRDPHRAHHATPAPHSLRRARPLEHVHRAAPRGVRRSARGPAKPTQPVWISPESRPRTAPRATRTDPGMTFSSVGRADGPATRDAGDPRIVHDTGGNEAD